MGFLLLASALQANKKRMSRSKLLFGLLTTRHDRPTAVCYYRFEVFHPRLDLIGWLCRKMELKFNAMTYLTHFKLR